MMVNFVFPMIYMAFTIFCYTLFIPSIYETIYGGMDEGNASIVIIHVYPLVDAFFYAMLIIISKYITNKKIQAFVEMLYFLNLGYAIGHILLVGIEEV